MDFLNNVRVIDFSSFLPGPYCTLTLAELGAEVIHVERPGVGEMGRAFTPGLFWTVSRNKKSVTIDIKSAAGQEICRKLIATADVVVEGYRPGVMARVGLDYASLKDEFPRLIYCSISGFGQYGPDAMVSGHDINYLALAGGLSMTSEPGRDPTRTAIPVGDLSSASFATTSIMAALYRRVSTGRGEYIDVAITDSILAWMSMRWGEFLRDGKVLAPHERPDLSPANRIYRCSDGKRISIGAVEDKFWQNLVRALDRPDLAAEPRYRHNPSRVEHYAELSPILEQIFLSRTRAEWIVVLKENDVPYAPALEVDEIPDYPQHVARGMFRTLRNPAGADYRQVPFPVKFANTVTDDGFPLRDLGADTDAVLAGVGYGEAARAALRQDGVI